MPGAALWARGEDRKSHAVDGVIGIVAEGVGFEPTIPVSQDKRLAGARTRPLCDPSPKRKFTIAE